jgi:hypothetical protein
MSEFFRGSRRKVGVMTLVLATAFMGGWVRSCNQVDFILIFSMRSKFTLVSGHQAFCFLANHGSHRVRFSTRSSGETIIVGDEIQPYLFRPIYRNKNITHDDPVRVTILDSDSDSLSDSFIAMTPYWSVVIPLTILAAFLLLTKPRQPTANEIPESIQNDEGATS